MDTRIKIIVLAAILALSGAGCVPRLAWPWQAGGRVGLGSDTCFFSGRSYRLGDIRPAEDGCNACTCGSTGWGCTALRCPRTAQGLGTIAGRVAYPDSSRRPLRVCAADLNADKRFCVQPDEGADSYELAAPGGSYWVYASPAGSENGRLAYFSEFVACGAGDGCKDHSPVTVKLASGQRATADPTDWFDASRMLGFSMTPSKLVDRTFTYVSTSVFNAESTGMEKVEILYRELYKYDEPLKTLLTMRLVKTENGEQAWVAPVPADFAASDVIAQGTDASGNVMRWKNLGRVMPDETASASSTE